MDLSCLTNVVGISTRDCACLDTLDAAYKESLSGYFLDDIEHGIPLIYPNKAQDCGDTSIWTVLAQARSQGINDFFTDLLATIYRENKEKYAAYSGEVGEKKNNTPLVTTLKDKIGLKISPKEIRGGLLRIHKIKLLLDTAITSNFIIYNTDFGVVDTIPFTNVAGTEYVHDFADTPKELPFFDANDFYQEYYILFDRGTAKPYNIKFHCGCGQGAANKPYYTYGDFHGVRMDTLDLDDETLNKSYTYGLILEISLTCDAMNWICFRDQEYITEKFARVMAKTIQLYAIKKMIAFVANSTRINRYTLLDQKGLYVKMGQLQKEINGRLPWLAENLPDHAQDCLTCKDAGRAVRATIRV